jgi:hypothetical protein
MAEKLLASQEGLSSMELFIYLNVFCMMVQF